MQGVLERAGHKVEIHGLSPPGRVQRTLRLLASGGYPWDLTIHTERAVSRWMDLSRRNVLLPNPEWFEVTPAVSKMDAILCKTRWTLGIMSALHARAIFTGFTSVDRRTPGLERAPLGPLHVVGRSQSKGTQALIEVWKRNREWPMLTVVAWKKELTIPADIPDNVRMVRDFVADSDLQTLQTTCGFHLCPSAAEGFGHTIVEGMSTGALVLTTDAPPMNEIVTAERGILVPWSTSEPLRAGRRFEVDLDRLEERIAEALAAQPSRVQATGEAARKWFEENNEAFERRLVEVVDELLESPPQSGGALYSK